jgi:hypothetical protein
VHEGVKERRMRFVKMEKIKHLPKRRALRYEQKKPLVGPYASRKRGLDPYDRRNEREQERRI